MLELLNVRFVFSLRTSHQNQDGKSAIVLRVSLRGERRDIFTGLYCMEKDWDPSATKVAKTDKSAATINQNLEMILHSAENVFSSCFDRLSQSCITKLARVNLSYISIWRRICFAVGWFYWWQPVESYSYPSLQQPANFENRSNGACNSGDTVFDWFDE